MTLKGLGEMFEGYSAETCAGKIPLVPMGVLSPLKKADFRRTKAKMGRVSQNGLCYNFEIAHHTVNVW